MIGNMPKGLKPTSGVIVISSLITESAANTFTTKQVDLQLNVLDREVFVVTAADIDLRPADNVANQVTQSRMSISTTERQSVGSLADSNVLAQANITLQNVGDTCVAVTEYSSTESPHAQLEYIGIIATNDFYLNIVGDNNVLAKAGSARLWGYRAQADAATFAALTQSELLST